MPQLAPKPFADTRYAEPAVSSPSDARASAQYDTTTPPSADLLSASPPPEPLLVAPPTAPPIPLPVSRDSSVTRGRALSATSPRNVSPRGITPATRPKQSLEVERKPSSGHGHHRQTSIVYGKPHSRNPSLLSVTNTSPLSPNKIMMYGAASEAASTGHVNGNLKKSPSISTLHSHGGNGMSLPPSRNFDVHTSARRPERMHSGKVKRSHEHYRSQSRQQSHVTEPKTVGEYALHHLFTSFIADADNRIELCVPAPGEQESRIETICGPGADSGFDQLISSLGHINRHKPKSVIDSVIHWRKKKADLTNQLYDELNVLRRGTQLTQRHIPSGSISATSAPSPGGHELVLLEHEVQAAERRSQASIYILCRVLIEIIGQTTLQALDGSDLAGPKTSDRLEEVIYAQLTHATPEQLVKQPLLHANWVIRGQLLGVMSGLRFEEVTDRFIKDLDNAQKTLAVKGLADEKLVAKTVLLLQSMKWLKVRSHPRDAWDHACDTMQLLAKFFAEVHGRPLKYTYAQLFENLMLPIAATATSELNLPKWKDVLATIRPKVTQMLGKQDHWPYVYPLQAVMLCVSPTDIFATQWMSSITTFQPRSKDRAGRSHALKAICRLVWRYLYRHSESQNAIARKLDEIVRLVFQGGKRVLISTDPLIADPLIQLIRIIGYKQQDICFRTIIFPLMNSELFTATDSQLKIESLDPEKTVIAIRAFLAIMADLERGEPPPFPTQFECDALIDPSSRSPITHRRTRSQGFAVSAGRTERLSRPVMTTNFNDVSKGYYVQFCKILGQLTIICDNTFGGQAVLDEKFASHTPKTPMAEAFNFNKRDELMNPNDLRQHYYDLLHVAVEALPRCLSPHLPINSIVNLLCTGTAHVQSHIATSSAQSLKAIARQSFAQQVTVGFARFIFNFDDRYATVSDNGLLGPGHIENTLKLYVELLQIWIEDIQQRARKAAAEPNDEEESTARPLPLDLSSILAHVDEIESHGLFFLCSPSRAVRAVAVNVLGLITKFDTALGKPCTRIISILEGGSQQVIDVNDERLSLAERSRLQKGLRKSNINSTLVELCSSDVAHDTNLWFKIFPNLIRLSSEICLHAVALTREIVCTRLSHSYKTIAALAEGSRPTPYAAFESAFSSRPNLNLRNASSPDITIEQWKLHLVFACTTLTNVGGGSGSLPVSSQSSQHTRKSSKSSNTSQDRVMSATELFSRVVPFLAFPNPAVRNAAVTGLGATNATLFPALISALETPSKECTQEGKERIASHQRSMSSPRRVRRTDYLRLEITHLLSLTCHLLKDPAIASDHAVLEFVVEFQKQVRFFLHDEAVQGQLEYQKLRTHFCTLTERLYDCTKESKDLDPKRHVSFTTRQSSFALMEDWCGFSPNEPQLRHQESRIRRSILDREHDLQSRGIIDSALEKEKKELQTAALSAMATLCAGPLTLMAETRMVLNFDVKRLLVWINSIFESPSDRIDAIGRKALQNLIVHNPEQPSLMAQTLKKCYTARLPKALTSYFEVVTKVLTEHTNVPTPFWKVLCAGLYTLGNEDSQIRRKSVRLLRMLEERQGKTSKLQDLDISVSDKTTAVYKLAQFEVSCRLAKQHPELAFHVFSEFSAYFNELQPDHQRNMVSGMLPWIQTIELQLDPGIGGWPTATSYMLLVNLFEITVKSRITLHNEIQALWQALATGPYAGNVQLILDFIIGVCLDRKEQNFVIYAKQIVVFLAGTVAGAKVVEYLMLQICPKTMVAERRDPAIPPVDTTGLPYIADLAAVLPSGAKQGGLSLGQLSMILLVDLIVSPDKLPHDKLAILLQVILVGWDQYIAIVQDQARELLVHLIHELVISKIEPGSTEPDKDSIEEFIEMIRRNDPKITWTYADSEIKAGEEDSRAVSEPMGFVVDEVVRIFSVTHPTIREEWGKVTMNWATSCAVRHVACRSFQVFRCISTTLDQQMLADMLARLSNTIADDENHDYLIFSLEILTTLRSIIDALEPFHLLQYPQLFWTTCACLDTIFEREFQEALSMLTLLVSKMDLSQPAVCKVLSQARPERWEGDLQGIHSLLYKGVRSSNSMNRSLAIMESLMKLNTVKRNALKWESQDTLSKEVMVDKDDVLGNEDNLLFTVLANLPRFLHHFDDFSADPSCMESAETLALAAESYNIDGYNDRTELARVLHGFANSKYRNEKDFLWQIITAVRAAYFEKHEFRSLVFLLGMVNNQCSWFKIKTMQVLCVIIPDVDMRKHEIASQGPDLISPLLRLLQTEHCQQALEVLDNVIDMSGTPLDNKHLRMSMAGSHSSRATRKEYDSTKSLYGIPEESGWSIPMPAVHSAQTRANVHAVFYTLAYAGLDGIQEEGATPDPGFHKDDFQYDTYFNERTMTMASDDTRIDGNMGVLAMKLDSLDDFFEDPPNGTSPLDQVGDRENLYDQQALPMLQKSLKRNPSVTSFQTGFADMRYPPGLEPAPVMSPGAFAQHQAYVQSGRPSTRPGLHSRSVTTPVTLTKQRSPSRLTEDVQSGEEGGDEPEPFSDDDLSISRTQTSEEHNHDTIKPLNIRANFARGFRRLTSGAGAGKGEAREAREVLRSYPRSPKVGKPTSSWLKDPLSGEA